MADSISNGSIFFSGVPTTMDGTMAAAADAILSRNGSFAARLTRDADAADTADYLPVPARRSLSGHPSAAPSKANDNANDSVFSPRDAMEGDEEEPRKVVAAHHTDDRDAHVETRATTTTADAAEAGDDDDDAPTDPDAKPKATPLPIWQVLIIGSVLLTESLSAMMLMPFVGLFVAHLMDWTVERAGYLSGVLVGMFMLGQVLSGKLWGRISDRYGRKRPLVLGLGVGAAMMFVFGISPNIYIACAARFIHGFFNGTVLIAKTVVSDITDDTNRAKGFAWVSLAWAIGSLVGPTIGGFLYDPATNSKFASYNISPDSFLGHNPAFLPSTVLAAYIAFSFVVCVAFLKESNPTDRSLVELIPGPVRRCCVRRGCTCLARFEKKSTDDNKEEGDDESELPTSARSSTRDACYVDADAGEDTAAVAPADESPFSARTPNDADAERERGGATTVGKGGEDVVGVQELATPHTGTADTTTATAVSVPATDAEEEPILDTFTYMDAIRYPPSRYLLLLFMLYCALEIIYSEIMPLWAVAGRNVGGLGLFSDDVAILLLVCGVPSLIANVVFPFLCDRVFAHNKMLFWQISIVINAVCTAVVPVAAYVHGNRGGFWFTLGIGLARQFGLSWCFGLAQYLVPYVAKKGHVGTMFGINQAAGSATRCIIPFGAAPLFAWSVSGEGRPFPVNHFLLFMICVLCAIATFIISFFLKLPIEVAYREEKRARKLEAQQQEEEAAAVSAASSTHGCCIADDDEPVVVEGEEMAAKEDPEK